MEFQSWPKIPRWNREIIITEKIDGTNGQVFITPVKNNTQMRDDFEKKGWRVIETPGPIPLWGVVPGSRNKFVTTSKDNYGFCVWVNEHAEELMQLGPGRHYGEWWGKGIQRHYDLKERKFSLFNTSMYTIRSTETGKIFVPDCCDVVPVLYQGILLEDWILSCLDVLSVSGSSAAPEFMRPEGIVIFHTASSQSYKITLENDESHKGELSA